eukprot:102927_1
MLNFKKYFSIKNCEQQMISTSIKWNKYVKKRKDKCIDFSYYFKISLVKYNEMRTHCNWSQIFDLTQFTQRKIQIFDVNDFNNWKIGAKSMGNVPHRRLVIDVCLLELPHNINSLRVEYKVEFNYLNRKCKQIKSEIIDFCPNVRETIVMDYYTYVGGNWVEIVISLQIIKIVTDNLDWKKVDYTLLPKRWWKQYGFIQGISDNM